LESFVSVEAPAATIDHSPASEPNRALWFKQDVFHLFLLSRSVPECRVLVIDDRTLQI
jgi:hypothetical protein